MSAELHTQLALALPLHPPIVIGVEEATATAIRLRAAGDEAVAYEKTSLKMLAETVVDVLVILEALVKAAEAEGTNAISKSSQLFMNM